MAIKQKGFKEYLADDPSLAEKFTYEEFYGQKMQHRLSKTSRLSRLSMRV